VVGIVCISMLPILWGYLINRYARTPATKADGVVK
jgi:hypothetical protein